MVRNVFFVSNNNNNNNNTSNKTAGRSITWLCLDMWTYANFLGYVLFLRAPATWCHNAFTTGYLAWRLFPGMSRLARTIKLQCVNGKPTLFLKHPIDDACIWTGRTTRAVIFFSLLLRIIHCLRYLILLQQYEGILRSFSTRCLSAYSVRAP